MSNDDTLSQRTESYRVAMGTENAVPPPPVVTLPAPVPAPAANAEMAKWDAAFVRKGQVEKKEGQKLGISISEEDNHDYCTLISFKEEGAIPDAKVFKENDIILEVNDTYVGDMEHEDLVATLVGCFPDFTLTVINEADVPKPALAPVPTLAVEATAVADEYGLRTCSYSIQATVTEGAISPEERGAPAPTATPKENAVPPPSFFEAFKSFCEKADHHRLDSETFKAWLAENKELVSNKLEDFDDDDNEENGSYPFGVAAMVFIEEGYWGELTAVFNAFPDVAKTSNLLGPEGIMTALAAVLVFSADSREQINDELVLRILAANPEAAKVKIDLEGGDAMPCTPLYLAINAGCNQETIVAIAAAWPEASKEECRVSYEGEGEAKYVNDFPINALIKSASAKTERGQKAKPPIHPATMLACLGITADVAVLNANVASLKATVSQLEGRLEGLGEAAAAAAQAAP